MSWRAPVMMAVLLLSLPRCAALAQAQSAAAAPEGLTESSLVEQLGTPASEGRSGDIERLEYSTPSGSLVFYVLDGRVSLHRPVRTSGVPPTKSVKPKDLGKAAKKSAKAGDLWGALALIDACLHIVPASHNCTNDLQTLSKDRWKEFSKHFDGATEEQLATIDEFTRGVLALQPSSAPMLEAHEKTHAAIRRINQPRVAAAHTAFLQDRFDPATALARAALLRGDYPEATRILAPFAADPGVAPRLRDAAATWIDTRVTNLQNLPATLRSIDALRPALGPELTARARSDAFDSTIPLIRDRIGFLPSSPAAARAIKEVAVRNVPELGSQGPGFWERVMSKRPMLTVQSSTAIEDECQGAISPDEISNGIGRAMPNVFVSPYQGDVQANVAVRCRSEVVRSVPRPLPSEYQSTTQQYANPEYPRTQSSLQAAREELAEVRARWEKNPPVNDIAAQQKTKEIQQAEKQVERLAKSLERMEPYFERPVYAPYVAYATDITKSATVDVDAEVFGRGIASLPPAHFSMDWRETGREVVGVVSSDQHGLRNQVAVLPTDDGIYRTAYRQRTPERVFIQLRTMTRDAAIEMLASTSSIERPLDAIGMALFVNDVDPGALPNQFSGLLGRLDGVSLDTLSALAGGPARASESERPLASAGAPASSGSIRTRGRRTPP